MTSGVRWGLRGYRFRVCSPPEGASRGGHDAPPLGGGIHVSLQRHTAFPQETDGHRASMFLARMVESVRMGQFRRLGTRTFHCSPAPAKESTVGGHLLPRRAGDARNCQDNGRLEPSFRAGAFLVARSSGPRAGASGPVQGRPDGRIIGEVALTVSYRQQERAEDDITEKRSACSAPSAQLCNPSPAVRLAGLTTLSTPLVRGRSNANSTLECCAATCKCRGLLRWS